jgi:hypothetical protein
MRFCEKHWKDLRDAIEVRGLKPLVAKDGNAAIESAVRQIEGTHDNDDFDPLMGAYWLINAQIVKIRGLMFMASDSPYGGCAMCEPDDGRPEWASQWINGAADDALTEARRRGLAPSVY